MSKYYDLLLVQPMVGPPDLYVQGIDKLSAERLYWYRRLTRVPQGLLSIATYLKQHGYKVKIFDARLHLPDLEEDFKMVAQRSGAVAFSCLTMHIPQCLAFAKLVRDYDKDVPIIWGGVHPTLFPEQTAQHPLVDYVVNGEGEYPMLDFMNCFYDFGCKIENVRSLVYRDGGKVRSNTLAQPFDMAHLEFPDYDMLELERYISREPDNPHRVCNGLDYNGSRGCCYKCGFCINHVTPQNCIWRGKSAEKVIEDIKVMKYRYGVEYVFFEEELPFVNKRRILQICDGIKDLGITWYANVRADIAANDKEILSRAREAGWRETSVGCEAGSQRMLDYLNKQVTIDQIIETAKRLDGLDVYSLYSFMTDLPTETVGEKLATMALMRKLKHIHPKSEFIGPQKYRLYPKTEWYEQLKREGKFKEPSNLQEWSSSGLSTEYAM